MASLGVVPETLALQGSWLHIVSGTILFLPAACLPCDYPISHVNPRSFPPQAHQARVDALEPADKDQVIFDAELPGFGIKVTPSGRKVFLVQYRYPPGRLVASGATPSVLWREPHPDQARGIAVQVKGKLAAGIDPVSEREPCWPTRPRPPRRRSASTPTRSRSSRPISSRAMPSPA
jgi:hypothetical protein